MVLSLASHSLPLLFFVCLFWFLSTFPASEVLSYLVPLSQENPKCLGYSYFAFFSKSEIISKEVFKKVSCKMIGKNKFI